MLEMLGIWIWNCQIAGASKPVYPDLMSELKALNIGRDNEPAPSYSSTPSWSQPAYQPPAPQPSYLQPTPLPQPSYHQPAPPQPTYHPPPAPPQPVMQRQGSFLFPCKCIHSFVACVFFSYEIGNEFDKWNEREKP